MMNEQDVNTYLNFLSDTAFEILYVLEENELTAQEIQQALFERNAVNEWVLWSALIKNSHSPRMENKWQNTGDSLRLGKFL